MGRKRGRTCRKRGRKRAFTPEVMGRRTVNISHEMQYVQLRKWLKENGCIDLHLVPAHFPDTGRGLMTTKALQPGDTIIALPEKCLLTTQTVHRSYLGKYIERWKPRLSPLQVLCTFLVAERHFGRTSPWKPYIDVLPKAYTCPGYLAEEVLRLLPEALLGKAEVQRRDIRELTLSSEGFFHSLQPLFAESVEGIFTSDALRWAWCSVNTRTVYMERLQSEYFSREPDVYALAPYLDLLNHSPTVQVTAGFNQESKCYEIRTLTKCRRYQQAFICYGPHDNQRLLLEYGFFAANNPHSVIYVEKDVLRTHLLQKDKELNGKLSFLQDRGFLENLTFGFEGPSWRLLAALKVLCLGPDNYSQWKKVLIGLPDSVGNERNSLDLASSLCSHLMNENQKVLQKIYKLMSNRTELLEQLDLVAKLREEERKILQASLVILQRLRNTTTS
eukprot:gi/632975283/ref/XP_007904145.1/ PREDICTED: SET domain-containing protein 4 isoform X1 [Callorhinchus milii]